MGLLKAALDGARIRQYLSGALVAAGLSVTLAANAVAADFEFRLSHPLPAADETHIAMVAFAEAVVARSDGRIGIEVFAGDQMGAMKEVGEMLVQGANVIQFTDYLYLAQWEPDAAILQAPFLLDDPDDWHKLAQSDWMKEFETRLLKHNIRALSNNYYFGSRGIIGSKPVRSPDDIKGETLREAPAQMYIEMARSWGARPVVIGFGEVYTGLSQGVVDFVECPPQTMASAKFTELRKVVSLTDHMHSWLTLVVSDAAYQQLPDDLKQVMVEESVKAGELLTRLKRESLTDTVAKFKADGLTVVDDIDRAAFRDASLAAYQTFTDWTPGLTETVRGILDN